MDSLPWFDRYFVEWDKLGIRRAVRRMIGHPGAVCVGFAVVLVPWEGTGRPVVEYLRGEISRDDAARVASERR